MRNRILPVLCLLVTFLSPLSAQIVLDNEELRSGSYRLTFHNTGYSYSIQQDDRRNIIHFDVPFDEGSEAAPTLPRKDLFIALPPDTRPAFTFLVTGLDRIANVVPALAPNIRRVNDSLHAYTPAAGAPQRDKINTRNYTFNGYLWIGSTYCAHITVYPYLFDEQRGDLSVVKEFTIEFAGIAGIEGRQTNALGTESVSGAVVNKKNALAWRSDHPAVSGVRTDGWIDYSQEYLKLGVSKDDVYRLTYSFLQSSGVPVATLNPRSFKLYMRGKEIPVYVRGESDNSFGPGDYIEFLGRRNYGDTGYRTIAARGTPYHEYLNLYSDTTIYWLCWDGGPGSRVDTVLAAAGPAADTTKYYDELVHKELNYYWDFALAGDDVRLNSPYILENETWHEGNLGVGTLPVSFAVDNLYPNKPARAFVKLQDYASNIDANAHNLALSINANAAKYDSGFINKFEGKVLTASFASSALTNGDNRVNIHSFPTANTINTVIRDWYELEYPRYLRATNDSLFFAYRSPAPARVSVITVSGLTSSSVVLYKFRGADSAVTKITNYSRSNDTLRFTDTITAGTSYFLMRDDGAKRPFVFYKKKFVNLRDPSNRAEYIAITHPYFLPSAKNYLSFISSTYGISTKLVDVNDIYDEFNDGFLAPEPIREFLKSARQFWQAPAPRYVFLIGKGTYDYYGNKSRYFSAPRLNNFVPSYGNPVSDTWFTLWDSTGALIPQMDIGRLPAKNLDEFQSYFSKHQKYVSKGYDDWNKRYLFFSGGNFTDPAQIAKSKAVNVSIINDCVEKPPIGGIAANFYKTASPVSNFGPYSAEFITNAINQGGMFISYIGHSGTQTWDNSITDISQLANTRDRNPLITDFGCSTGKFAEPDVLSFSELATNDVRGQAIAYIGNSSLGFESTAFSFPQVFYKKLLIDTLVSIGETHRLAKADYVAQYGTSSAYGLFVMTNTLIGDPIVKLPIPPKPNLSVSNSVPAVTPERPTEQADTIHIGFTYNNYGMVTGDSVEIQVSDDYRSVSAFSKIFKRPMPSFADVLNVDIPVAGMPGEHRLSVRLDPSNRIDEITKSDNNLTSAIIIASSGTRSLAIAPSSNQTAGELAFLNPSVKTTDTKFTLDVSTNSAFAPSRIIQVPFDTFYTRYRLDASFAGQRVWIKTKNEKQDVEGLTYSYFFGGANNYFIGDSLSYSSLLLSSAKVNAVGIVLDTLTVSLSAISAGMNDGRTAVILKNGQNFIPENTLRGHHVVLFDAQSYDFFKYFRFDVYSGVNEVNRYKSLLDTLSSKYIVCIAISDEGGSNLDTQLKNYFRQLGSILIDSVGFRNSWAIIGRKGAAPGSVPEKFSRPFAGRVQVDTSISIPNTRGSFETEPIGPVAAWKNAAISYAIPAGGAMNVAVIGIRQNNTADTLKSMAPGDSTIDLSAVDAQVFPSIKLRGELMRPPGQASPTIRSIAVNYDRLAELGTNYQAVSASVSENGTQSRAIADGDTVMQGEKVQLTYRVYNAGGVAAKKFAVRTASIWDNTTTESIASTIIDSLAPQSYKELSAVYNTSLGFGRRSLRITIDPDTTIRELYKDNNFYAFPIYVKKDSAKPLLPNLFIARKNIAPVVSPVTDENDSARFVIVYGNSGAFINDSITVSIRQLHQGSTIAAWSLRRKYPAEADTIMITVPILKRAGEHQLQVELDPVGLIAESSESDNIANYFFTVVTTDFKILQPTAFSAGSYAQIIFLNPTNSIGATDRSADLELDSLETFETAQKTVVPMREFTTTYDISRLPRPGRYFWRIRQKQSDKGWTAGSFYLGDAAPYAIGQSDRAAWMKNSFVHASYGNTGAQIADTRAAIRAVSAGFSDGRTGSVDVNGINVLAPIFGTGHNVVVFDSSTFAVSARRRFDVSNNADESDSLAQFVAAVPPGFIVADVIVDEGSNNLKQTARDALKTIGSAFIDRLARRDSWAIIGHKGAMQGGVPESYVPQFGGPASAETVLVRKEYQGTIVTASFGPLEGLSAFTMTGTIPAGTSVRTQFVGTRDDRTVDTLLLTSGTMLSNSALQNSMQYREGRIVFTLQTAGLSSPAIGEWRLAAKPFTELAVSERSATINRTEVMEGEPVVFTGKIYNVSSTPAESVAVELSTNEGGFERILKSEKIPVIQGNDSSVFSYTYPTKAKRGNHAFTMTVDPQDSVLEQSNDNNVVSVAFVVQSDTIRPQLQVVVDGMRVFDGDYIRQKPEIIVRYTDNNPSAITPADTGSFKIRLNNFPVYFAPGIAVLDPSSSPGQVQLKWTPELPTGENFIQIYATDVSGNSSDTTTLFVNVSSEFTLKDVYNMPNPFAGTTHFTFNLLSPVNPDEVSIKIFTVAGRLIQDLSYPCKIGFNTFYWDGRDKDGDEIANGVYLYKVIVKQSDKRTDAISKLVKMR